jgi:hypothetical protein
MNGAVISASPRQRHVAFPLLRIGWPGSRAGCFALVIASQIGDQSAKDTQRLLARLLKLVIQRY